MKSLHPETAGGATASMTDAPRSWQADSPTGPTDRPEPCEKFLYVFKAARRAARAAATARTPPLPPTLPRRRAPTPVGWRERRETFGPPLTDRHHRDPAAECPCSRCGIVQGRSEPVKAVYGRGTTAPVELPGGGTREDDLD
jgi:hypothetical protein